MSSSNSELVAITVAEQIARSLAPIADAESSGEWAIGVESLLDDHTELRKMVARLRGLCLTLSGNQAPADLGAAALVEEFAYLAIAHFAAEQASDFLENLSRNQPGLLQRIERLQTEHGEIAAALGQVLELGHGKPPGPELAIHLTHALDMFDAHERAEKAIIQELVLVDEGGSGE
jgi:hypothetical protein